MSKVIKRYMLFTGHDYYPSGGYYDLQAFPETIEEGIEIAEEEVLEDYSPDCGKTKEEYAIKEWRTRWAHIYDVETNDVVWRKEVE